MWWYIYIYTQLLFISRGSVPGVMRLCNLAVTWWTPLALKSATSSPSDYEPSEHSLWNLQKAVRPTTSRPSKPCSGKGYLFSGVILDQQSLGQLFSRNSTCYTCYHWAIYITVHTIWYPIGSMYAIYGNIYHQYTSNVSIYIVPYMDPMGTICSIAVLKGTEIIPSMSRFVYLCEWVIC